MDSWYARMARGVGKPGRQQARPNAASLKARQQVHMNMGGIALDDGLARAVRMVDHEAAELVRRPVASRASRTGRHSAPARPPVPLKLPLERGGVEGADDIAADPKLVLRHETARGAEDRVERGVDVTDQFGVAIEARRVRAGFAPVVRQMA